MDYKLYSNLVFPILTIGAFFIGIFMRLPFEYTWMLIVMITLFKIELNTQWMSDK